MLSRRLNPLVYGRGAAQSAAWSTVSRAVAPLLLAAAAGLGASGYPIGFAVAVVVGIAGAVVAYRSLLAPHLPATRPRRPPCCAGLTRSPIVHSAHVASTDD